MTALPPDGQARIERALAELELAVIRLQQHPPRITPDSDGGWNYVGPSPTDLLLTAIFAALGVIVEVVTNAGLTAADRRQTVAAYQEQVLTRYALARVTFDTALREQPWWERFQRGLVKAERTDIPSFAQQLGAFMEEVHWKDEDLAAATTSSPRTVERHRTGRQRPTRNSIAEYEKALSAVRGPTRFVRLPTPLARRRPKKS